jgi:thiol-disulfide isomerase/thioredoxin
MLPSLMIAGAIGATGLGVFGFGSQPASASVGAVSAVSEVAAPKLLVVKYHADWCGKCKAMQAPLETARAAVADEPVLFVTFDFTDTTRAKQSEYLASVLGFDDAWGQYERQTGFGLLVDPASGKVVGELRSPDAAAIESAIRAAL